MDSSEGVVGAKLDFKTLLAGIQRAHLGALCAAETSGRHNMGDSVSYAKHHGIMARTDARCSMQSPSLDAPMRSSEISIISMYAIQNVERLPLSHLRNLM